MQLGNRWKNRFSNSFEFGQSAVQAINFYLSIDERYFNGIPKINQERPLIVWAPAFYHLPFQNG